jgi:Fe-S oxidoreductase
VARTWPAKWAAGVDRRARLPRFTSQTFRDWFHHRGSRAMGSDRLVLWPDTFNNHFRPQTLIAATQLLERAGFRIVLPAEPLCCGRPLYDWGYLDRAKEQFERTFRVLAAEISAGTPIVAFEPACASTFKDELLNLFPDRSEAQRLSAQVDYFADFVADRIDRFPDFLRGGSALVQAHCHHHAVIGFEKEKQILDRLEISIERPPQGCCGMAGAFGMAKETFEVGRKIGERVLLPRVRELDPDTIVVADGFSCREQIEIYGGRGTMHIAELLRERMI